MEYKIFSYVDELAESYLETINLTDGLVFDQRDTLRTIEFYTNSQYLSGNTDQLGREKPFYNVINYRVTVAKIATDLDVKDIKFEPDTLDVATQSMILNHELYKYLKEINFSKTLNDMGLTRPKYGGLLVKWCKYEDTKKIEVVDWRNVEIDPVDIESNPIIENHYLTISELSQKEEWYDVDEVIEAYQKETEKGVGRINVKEVTGMFSHAYDPDLDDSEAMKKKYKMMCFYIACVGDKKFLLYKEDLKKGEKKYKYLPWEYVPGRGLGRGIVEDGFQSQVWVNDAMIAMKNAMDLSGKVVLSTTSKRVTGNAITDVENGHIFELEDGKTITSLNLLPSAFPQFNTLIDLWNIQYDKTSSTYNANTGEAPTAGTPYSQTALLNQVANSPFEYQREIWGIFLNECLNEWILPELKKRISKKHYLVSEFSKEELDVIDNAIIAKDSRKMIKDRLLQGIATTPSELSTFQSGLQQGLAKFGSKREIDIPEGWLDIDGKITANITGELKNKQAILASLDSLFKTVAATFNPNTGKYGALEDPVLSQIFGRIVEIAGVGVSFPMLKRTSGEASAPTQPTATPDLTAITPENAGTPIA